MSPEFSIGNVKVGPGASSVHKLELFRLPDGTAVETSIVIVNGVDKGPTLYMGAASHGDEVNGIEICRRMSERINPKKLTGTVVMIPVHNPVAFWLRQRMNPFDAHLDLNRVFPGKPEGSLNEAIGYKLYEVASRANFVIDFHTAMTGGRFCGSVLYVPSTGDEVGERSLVLAKCFGGDIIIETKLGKEYEGTILDKTITMVAAANGIPGFLAELGTGNLLEEQYIEAGIRGVENVMKKLGMIEGQQEPTSAKSFVCSELVPLRVKYGGLVHIRTKLGVKVKRGELLAQVYTPLRKIEDITAPFDGLVVRKTTYAVAYSGDHIIDLGR